MVPWCRIRCAQPPSCGTGAVSRRVRSAIVCGSSAVHHGWVVSRGGDNDLADRQTADQVLEAEDQLRRLLMAWDPIGVAELPNTEDEYDCLLMPMMQQLRAGVSVEQLRDWFCRELDAHFGLTPDPTRELPTASRICSWWETRARRTDQPEVQP